MEKTESKQMQRKKFMSVNKLKNETETEENNINKS